MSWWAAVTKAYHVAAETHSAVTAAEEVLTGGGTPFDALRAFAAATDGQLDDETVAILEQGLRKSLIVLERGTFALAWLVRHEPTIRHALERATDYTVDIGYQAGRVRHMLQTWLA